MLTEDEIIQACKNGDRKSQKILFDKYGRKIFGLCVRYTKNKQDAEDLLHDGFVIIFEKINSFNFESSIFTWMGRVVINKAISEFRKKKITFTDFDNLDDVEDEIEEPITDKIWEGFNKEDAIGLLNLLPDKYRIVLNMYAIENMSHKEIAETLKISVNTSKSNLLRARKKLIEIVKEKNN